ncbi:40S ribosomal protein S19 [Perkinsela sp. CCAP 1560/4]|nr:40S ribosomal protein S19 [Perkinsela sp. CCAP 1560/4]|eukprot:KNH01779.1 40S ribosomal protein S19 [Perkinsela sp. CCAP 1560/4]
MVKSRKACRGGCGVKDVDANQWIEAFAQHLKAQGKLNIPEFVDYAKTGVSRVLPPSNPDWFYVKSAAILRRVYIRPFTGIGGLKKVFGSTWGQSRPLHFKKASGSVIRKSLQALEALNLIAKSDDEGRVITKIGRRDCDRVAMKLLGRTKSVAN